MHKDLLDFTVTGYFTEVSSREALNRFYRISQEGLGVVKALDVVTRAIQNHDVDRIMENLVLNVETVSHVQSKIEWLEVFFVSFYAAELANILSERLHFSGKFAIASITFWALAGVALALFGLKPWKTSRYKTGLKEILINLGLITMLIILWFAVWLLVS